MSNSKIDIETTEQTDQQKENQFVGANGETTGIGFSARDAGVKTEEQQGIVEFRIITNDKDPQHMRMLIDLKNIIARQLPKMPKEYIVKLIFDRKHEAMVIVKNDTKIIGGICFRPFESQKFAEIAFLAVTANEQVKGYGTRLMNKYKEEMQRRGIEYLLTYADNYAIGYFKKQGFSKSIKMPSDRWKGFIKEYDGGTFMECYIHSKIDYNNISNMIKAQKERVINIVKGLCINHIKYDAPKELLERIRNSVNDEGIHDLDLVAQVPGLKVGGWTAEEYYELKKSKERSFNLQCQNIIEMLRRHKSAWPFLEAVSKDDVPDYYEVIKDPIDIKTIEKRLQANYYLDKEVFVKDVIRMFTNARVYNLPETIYVKASNELEEFITPYLAALKDDQSKLAERSFTGSKSAEKNPARASAGKKKSKKDK